MQFDLRNGSIRKKYDSLKYTVKKLENTLYELSLAEAGFKPEMDTDEVNSTLYHGVFHQEDWKKTLCRLDFYSFDHAVGNVVQVYFSVYRNEDSRSRLRRIQHLHVDVQAPQQQNDPTND